jgi:hypothetical protein
MRGKAKKQIVLILFVPVLLSTVVFAEPEAFKIKIRTETAQFRLEPDSAEAVARESIFLGKEYGAEGKNIEWYEFNLRLENGIRLPTSIHKSHVELFADTPSNPAVHSPSPGAAKKKRIGAPAGKRLVLSLGGGPVFLPSWRTTITGQKWFEPYEALLGMDDSNTMAIALNPPTSVGFGLGLTYFLSPSLGIQFRIDIIPNRPIVDGKNVYTMTWRWSAIPTSYSLDPSPTWPIAGHFRAHPVSLGILGRLLSGSRIQPYFQASIAYFLCRFKADSQIGYARTWVDEPYQYVDYFILPASIDEYFNRLGFMSGAGLEWLLGSKTAMFVQADYFAGPSQEVGWSVKLGTYSAQFSSVPLSVDKTDASIIRGNLPPFTVEVGNLFRLLGGIKIVL